MSPSQTPETATKAVNTHAEVAHHDISNQDDEINFTKERDVGCLSS